MPSEGNDCFPGRNMDDFLRHPLANSRYNSLVMNSFWGNLMFRFTEILFEKFYYSETQLFYSHQFIPLTRLINRHEVSPYHWRHPSKTWTKQHARHADLSVTVWSLYFFRSHYAESVDAVEVPTCQRIYHVRRRALSLSLALSFV